MQIGEVLTKREWMAAQILPALIREYSDVPRMAREDIVPEAVRYADTLIRALNEIEIGG